ncbi:MHS family MFS transporter [Anaplasmataceae bacterium AB001_6]|nr:MHS family MFS transporter [Anaplasmataceae bacterium AB001_6]
MQFIVNKLASFFLEDTRDYNKLKILLITMLANSVIWYEYAMYGSLLTVIGNNFFPVANEYMLKINSLIIFSIGFLARPMGSVFFGHIGDRYNRKTSLNFSLLTMTCPSLMIALLPGYSAIGFMSIVILVMLRFTQGFALGGESGNAVYLIENCVQSKRGINSCTEILSAIVGALLATLVIKLLHSAMSDALFNSLGWRIGFVLGFLIGLIVTIMRNSLQDKYVSKINKKDDKSEMPLFKVLKDFKKITLLSAGSDLVEIVVLYFFLISMVSNLLFSIHIIDLYKVPMLIIMAFLTIFFGYLSDLIGRRKIMLSGMYSLLFLSSVMLYFLQNDNPLLIILAMTVIVIIISSNLGPMNAFLLENLPFECRFTTFALARNLSAAVGGMTPLIIEILNYQGIVIYMSIIAVIGIICVSYLKEGFHNPLPKD